MKRLFPLLLLLTACTTAQIDLPSDAYGVEGANPRRWNQPLAFGPYRTTFVDEVSATDRDPRSAARYR
jgi:hypothetical protein